MYATGIGLVLYGIEMAEEEAQLSQESAKKGDTSGHVDIFADMEVSAPAAAKAADQEAGKPQKTEVKKDVKKRNNFFDKTINDFLNKVIREDIDND